MSKFFKDIFTEYDNITFDILRVAIGMLVLFLPFILITGIYTYVTAFWAGKNFDIQSFFNSIFVFYGSATALISGGALGLFLKQSTEPYKGK